MNVVTKIGAAACGVAAAIAGVGAPAGAHGGGHPSHANNANHNSHVGHGGHGQTGGTASGAASIDGRSSVAVVRLGQLNDSGAHGVAVVRLRGTRVSLHLVVSGVLRNAPHAMHFHAGAAGRCPTRAADVNSDGVVSVTEGHPFYGGVVTSLTTSGDTSPSSALAIDRFPTAPRGTIVYHRQLTVTADVAASIRARNAVLVVHGTDGNNSGTYDGALVSDLDPNLPMEATAPAACGAILPFLTL
ncbi:MAG TPA: hypothetical protein VES42_22185 [Pilimelia sp.]|nr:hypothetical protein [Pilimelia sp.]